jgi:hypothetical protein
MGGEAVASWIVGDHIAFALPRAPVQGRQLLTNEDLRTRKQDNHSLLKMWPISTRLNSPMNDEAALLEEIKLPVEDA